MGSLHTTLLQSMVIACLRSELALQFVFSATATEHGCSLRPTVIRKACHLFEGQSEH